MDSKHFYCSFVCKKGCEQRNKFMDECESVFDVVSSMQSFVKDCSVKCLYKEKRDTFIIPKKL